MDISMKVQGSGSIKALGIGELLASACSASAPLDPIIDIIPSQDSRSGIKVQIIKLCRVASCCQQ